MGEKKRKRRAYIVVRAVTAWPDHSQTLADKCAEGKKGKEGRGGEGESNRASPYFLSLYLR